MSDKDSPSTKPADAAPALDREAISKLRVQVFGNLFDRLKPWLVEFGNWIFGGLIAFNLIIAAALLTVGPAHLAVLISVGLFACALPVNVSGLFLLRLITDMKDVSIDDMMRQAFQDANVPNLNAQIPASPEPEKETLSKKRVDLGLRYSIRLAAASVVLTLLGVIAAFWYMAWWIAVLFIVAVAICVVLCANVVARLMRPNGESRRDLKARYDAQQKTK